MQHGAPKRDRPKPVNKSEQKVNSARGQIRAYGFAVRCWCAGIAEVLAKRYRPF
jgi:hypothetical protein